MNIHHSTRRFTTRFSLNIITIQLYPYSHKMAFASSTPVGGGMKRLGLSEEYNSIGH